MNGFLPCARMVHGQGFARPNVLALLCLLPRPDEMEWSPESLVQELNRQGEQVGRAVLDILHRADFSCYQDTFPLIITGQLDQHVGSEAIDEILHMLRDLLIRKPVGKQKQLPLNMPSGPCG